MVVCVVVLGSTARSTGLSPYSGGAFGLRETRCSRWDLIRLNSSMPWRAFGIEIPNEAAERLTTVGVLHQFVVGALRTRGDFDVDSDATYEKLVDLVARQSGVPRERVRPDSSFVDDLGMD